MSIIQSGIWSSPAGVFHHSFARFAIHRFIAATNSCTNSGPSKMTPTATSFVISKTLEKSWLRAICHQFLASSRDLIASGDSAGTADAKERVNTDNERTKSFERQMLALALIYIIVLAWRFAAEWHRK
jgi:hypothetical protein